MKILWQQVSSNTVRPDYQKDLAEACQRAAEPGTVIEYSWSPRGLGGQEYSGLRHFDEDYLLLGAIAAERRGVDAIMIGNTVDFGLRQVRELVNIPVVGHLQTSLQFASMMAGNFSLIVSHPKFAVEWDRQIREYGYKDRMVSLDALDVEVTGYNQLFIDKEYEDRQLDHILDLGRKAVAKGAEVLLVFPPPLSIRLFKKGIYEIDGVPVLDTIPALVKMTEAMVKYRQLTGRFISRKLTYANPSKELIDKVLARHNLKLDT